MSRNISHLLFILSFFLHSVSIHSQHIIAGPVVGGVTDHSARIYVQTDSSRSFSLDISIDSLFATYNTIYLATNSSRYNAVTVDVPSLPQSATFYYRFHFSDGIDVRQGRFTTFPTEGQRTPLRIAVGSCNYAPNQPLFQHIVDFNPNVMLHLGDWNWPPAAFGNDMMLYPAKRASSFASRYNDSSMRTLVLPNIPIDYVYDDDFSWNDGEGWTYPTFSVRVDSNNIAHTQLNTVQMPAGIREGAIKAYFDHFPAYPAVDTSAGIYHSIKLGNVEILMLDLRNNRDPRHEAFHYDSATDLWSYAPAPHHTMLGEKQRTWLIDKLTHPTTDWQIIGSSVIFNKNYDTLLNIGIRLQHAAISLGGSPQSGAVLASQMSYNWAGYPYDHDTILALKNAGIIHDAIIVSGDSHSNMIDDGTNAGLPEMCASGLAANNEGTFNHFVDQYAPILGYPKVRNILWNGGGNGIDNTDYLNGFGTIEVYGKDSLRLCVYDENNFNMGCKTILHSSRTTNVSLINETSTVSVYPNPGSSTIQVNVTLPQYNVVLCDMLGSVLYQADRLSGTSNIDCSTFSSGLMLIKVYNEQRQLVDTKKWVKL